MPPDAAPREQGFTLLEVLVAAAIAALALAVLFQGAAGGVRTARVADHVQEAVARARSRLAVLEHGPAPALGELSGDDGGGFRWRSSVAQVGSAGRVVLYDLAVAESWTADGGEREVALHGRRVLAAPPEPP
jgi:prepilin-type N-terminal cleavage/methylation domain-containing protein